MKPGDLDFTAEVAHHEYDDIKIQIQDYPLCGPTMTAEVNDGRNQSISVTYDELKDMLAVFELYNKAREILKGTQE